MKCNHCGAEIPDDSVFCESCGKKIEKKQPSNKQKKTLLTAGIVTGAIIALIAIVWLLVPKNDTVAVESLYPIMDQNEKFGYIDEFGNIKINPQYDYAAQFSEGLAAVETNHKYGYINPSGQMVIYPQFDIAMDFHEGLAAVEVNGKWGCIDKNGTIVINPQFDRVANFSEGLAAVRMNGKMGFINNSGTIVITPQYEMVGDFHDGLAAIRNNDKCGYIDKKGNSAIAPIYENVGDFSDGMAPVSYGPGTKSAFIDKKGAVVIQTQFDMVGNFTEGIAPVCNRGASFDDDRYGYIDKTGKNITPLQFERIYELGFSGGITAALLEGSLCIIDKTGNIVNRYKCNDDADFIVYNGMVYVVWSDDGYKSKKNVWLDCLGHEVYSWINYSHETVADSTAY